MITAMMMPGFPEIEGPQCRPANTTTLVKSSPKEATVFGNAMEGWI